MPKAVTVGAFLLGAASAFARSAPDVAKAEAAKLLANPAPWLHCEDVASRTYFAIDVFEDQVARGAKSVPKLSISRFAIVVTKLGAEAISENGDVILSELAEVRTNGLSDRSEAVRGAKAFEVDRIVAQNVTVRAYREQALRGAFRCVVESSNDSLRRGPFNAMDALIPRR